MVGGKSKSRILTSLVALVLVIGGIWLLLRSPGGTGPMMSGQRASVWLDHHATNGPLAGQSVSVYAAEPEIAVAFLCELGTGNGWRWSLINFARELGGNRGYVMAYRMVGKQVAIEKVRRRHSAVMLGLLGSAAGDAVPVLLDRLVSPTFGGEKDLQEASNTIVALHRIGPANEDAIYATMLRLKESFSGGSPISAAAFEVLKDAPPEAAGLIPAILHGLRTRKIDQYVSRSSATARSLPGPVPPESIRLTELFFKGGGSVREAVAFKFWQNKWENPEITAAALEDPSEEVRIIGVELLALAPVPDAASLLPALRRLQGSTDYSIRLRAVDILRDLSIDSPEAREILSNMAENDPARIVRVWAGQPLEIKAAPASKP